MRHVDFSPLYRSTVGFDRLFTMLDSLGQPDQSQTYPPYNIERTGENTYRITMAVAGFDESGIRLFGPMKKVRGLPTKRLVSVSIRMNRIGRRRPHGPPPEKRGTYRRRAMHRDPNPPTLKELEAIEAVVEAGP